MIHTLFLLTCAAQAYNHGDATSDEQLVLEMINRARTNGTTEGTRLAITPNIEEGFPFGYVFTNIQPPLAMNPRLLSIARAHSRDMWTRSFFAHTNPDGVDPFVRMTNAGYAYTNAGENIAVSSDPAATAAALENNLMIDAGVAGRGHRMNLLDVFVPPPIPLVRREIGIGHYSNSITNGQPWRSFLTQDFGRSGVGPFLVGVVYKDTVLVNSFYDIGEGVPGVTITITGGGSTVSAPGGGFAIPCPTSGTVNVAASGGPLNTTLNFPVAFSAQNVYLAVRPTAGQILDTDGDGLPNAYETANGLSTIVNDAAGDADGDSFSNLVEYQRGTHPGLAGSFPGSGTGLSELPDTDGDLMNDEFEVAKGFNAALSDEDTNGTIDGNDDWDGDLTLNKNDQSPGTPPAPPPPPTAGGDSDGGGGGCGLLGAEALLLLLLLRRR